jgi:TPP-dependent pyruvate/acetoin dehydrogenase alpha subunit
MATTFRNLANSAPTPGSIAEPASSEIVPGPEVTASPSDPTMLRNLYSAMLLCRMVDQRAEQLARLGKLKLPVNLQQGLEATVIGSLIELRAGDAISSESSFAARMFSGQPLGLYFADLYGIRAEYLAFSPEAAHSTIHLAQKKLQRRNVMVVLLPEAANALGYWHEAATLAASERLAMIFVSINSALPTALGNSDARQRAAAYGIPGIAVDGGDVVAMWRVAQESIHRARAGAGPTLIDSHVPSLQSQGGDPLHRMQHYLDKRKLWKQAWKDELTQKLAAEIDEAQAFFPQTSERQ